MPSSSVAVVIMIGGTVTGGKIVAPGFERTVCVFTACGMVTGVIEVNGLNGVIAGVGFTTRSVMYTVSPGARVTEASFGVGLVMFGFPSWGSVGVKSFGLVMLATVIQWVS